MRVIGVDKHGNQHCWKCGGQGFTIERTTGVKVVLGIHANVTSPKLRCVSCGEFNEVGSATEYA
jgi:hypothetical protein